MSDGTTLVDNRPQVQTEADRQPEKQNEPYKPPWWDSLKPEQQEKINKVVSDPDSGQGHDQYVLYRWDKTQLLDKIAIADPHNPIGNTNIIDIGRVNMNKNYGYLNIIDREVFANFEPVEIDDPDNNYIVIYPDDVEKWKPVLTKAERKPKDVPFNQAAIDEANKIPVDYSHRPDKGIQSTRRKFEPVFRALDVPAGR